MRAAGMSSQAAAPLSRKVAREAVEWYLLEQSGQATPDELAASAHWRAHDPEHARAWAKVQQVSKTTGMLPPQLAAPLLHRPQRRVAMQALLALMLAPGAWMLLRSGVLSDVLADYHSGVGERRTIRLPDGGRLMLNTDSALDIAYTQNERLLTLRRGELLVETHADPRPFFVATRHGRIRALGTRFIVRQDENCSYVTVLEHAVEIAPRAPSATLRRVPAGQQSCFNEGHADLPMPAPPQADAWSRGMLVANNMRLDDFATELARYRPGLLRVEASAASLRLTGAFQLDDTGAVLENLTRMLPVDVLYRTPYWVTITARKN
ncbi:MULTISPECIES: FecR domain-containing protein [unclassified Janthinobacterium]|uniref:FecR domain-containing protein n=1 Tax=unclassified Janthinobacterium TaxID=2610881 RepID=UPI001622BCA9|nr:MULTISPECIES: FecR domain-containing protein [unclassified Janthinobacterium]MBB5607939.1 transmembrane sensor [Janthinobacterium sp. S3T4]MBB5613320.1 transmembrane sensor [Janthinobacterium sp. S3M3]